MQGLSSLVGAAAFTGSPNLLSVVQGLQVARPAGAGPWHASIREELKGTVWMLQQSPLQYTQDEGQTGPADGVRFIMYDVDATTGLPTTPLTEVGYLDMVESGEDPNDVDYSVVISDTPMLELSVAWYGHRRGLRSRGRRNARQHRCRDLRPHVRRRQRDGSEPGDRCRRLHQGHVLHIRFLLRLRRGVSYHRRFDLRRW